jgi:hypothetical protein
MVGPAQNFGAVSCEKNLLVQFFPYRFEPLDKL